MRKDFLRIGSMIGATACLSLAAQAAGGVNSPVKPAKPNVVLIFADDLGYADVGFHGCKEIPTPNIDSIARNGVVFGAGYVTAPVCAPSRVGLMTGRYQNRCGFEDNPGPFRAKPGIIPGVPAEDKFISQRLKDLGYATCMIGKQHTGKHPSNSPLKRGFDEYFGFNNGASEYFVKDNKKHMLRRNDVAVKFEKDYLTDAFGREAAAFIERNHKKPFFLYLAFNAVHGPLQAPPELLKKFSHIQPAKRRKMVAMNYSMDQNVGKVLEALKKYKLEENTIIFFLSDNGGKPKGNYSYNLPLRGQKGTLYEGGIRLPFCVQWKGHFPAGKKFEDPVISMDIYPTAVAAAGGKVDPKWKLDGVNLIPYLEGKIKTPPHKHLFWRFNWQWAVRDNDWKLVKLKGKGGPKLFHISKDMCEKKNVINEYPEVAARLKKTYDEWSASLMRPQWGWQPSLVGKYKVTEQDY